MPLLSCCEFLFCVFDPDSSFATVSCKPRRVWSQGATQPDIFVSVPRVSYARGIHQPDSWVGHCRGKGERAHARVLGGLQIAFLKGSGLLTLPKAARVSESARCQACARLWGHWRASPRSGCRYRSVLQTHPRSQSKARASEEPGLLMAQRPLQPGGSWAILMGLQRGRAQEVDCVGLGTGHAGSHLHQGAGEHGRMVSPSWGLLEGYRERAECVLIP